MSPPSLELRPCEAATLEITGHYDDGTTRDLSDEPGLSFAFETGNVAQSGSDTVVMTGLADDVLTIAFDGVDSPPVPIRLVSPNDLSLCVVFPPTTTTTSIVEETTTSAPSTTTTTTTTTTSTTSRPPTTSPPPTTTTTTLPPPNDLACLSCVRDRVQHRFRIQNHLIFQREQLVQDRCAATEFPIPFFRVAADGTQSSVFDVQQVVEGSCQTTLTDPNPHLLDDNFQPIVNPDPDQYGTVFATDRRPDYVRFEYTHPTTPPPDGHTFRVVRIGIFYLDRRNPGLGEHLARVLEIRVYRPPVLMIHGLWSDAGAFTAMEQTLSAANYDPFQLYRLDYRGTNDSAFTVNFPLVAGGVDALIQQAVDGHLAAGKVDLVTHSMGGVISRLYMQDASYGHEVRRLVTCNTPHAGSQMANLLLDRTFDPQGLVCSLLSQAMSSPSLPNRGCYNGAVDDMQVSSFATTNFLNLGTHPNDVAVHGLATVLDPATLPDVSVVAGAFGAGPFVIARFLQACGVSLVDDVFGSDDSDLIVSATSQSGGLSGPLTSLYSDQAHMGSTANAAVMDRVKGLLNEPDGSSSFTRAGYSPGQLGYTTPSSICPLFRRGTAAPRAQALVAAGITITSPGPGTSVAPGDSLPVDVSGSPDVATVVLVMSQPGGDTVVAEQPGPDAHFDVTVPQSALGLQNLVVAGIDASGRLVAVSDTVHVDVVVSAVLNAITVYPPVVYLRPCAAATLEITGHYDDGVARDLSEQAGLTLTFANGTGARSGPNGVVLHQPGDDTLTVTFGGVDSAPVPVRVLAPDDLGLCGVDTTTTTTTTAGTTSTTTPPFPTTTAPPTTTTSTTTTPAPTTTTSTVPPPCQDDGDCDDGDDCTTDACTPGGCAHVEVAGMDGAECLLAAALAEPLCPAGTIDPKLERFATGKLEQALALVRNAALATKPKRQQRLLAKATRALGKISHRKPGTTTDECLARLTERIDAVLAALSEAPRHTIGGTVTGLEGTGLILHERSGDAVAPGNGVFAFAVAQPSGYAYAVTVASQPVAPVQVCTVSNDSGTVGDTDVTDVTVACVTPAPGTGLDPGFGDAGTATTGSLHQADAVALQPDGKIVVAGNAGGDFAVARYTPDGRLDATFGTGGTVTTGIGGEAFDVAIQPDGKIVVAGRVSTATSYDFGLARYEADGTLDPGFGTGGTVTTDFGGGADYAQGVVVQADGKIVAAGHARLGQDNDFALARYDADGSLDASFGVGGRVTTDVAGVTDLAQAVILQPDGKIVVAGQVDPSGGFHYHVGLARYDVDGRLDASFGSGGTVVGDPGSAYAVAVQPDGRIVTAGDGVGTATFDLAVARYDADGTPDPTFGSGGRITTDTSGGDDFGKGLALQPDGRIVVVGSSASDTIYDLAIVRYEPDGRLDGAFGTGGLLTVDFHGSGEVGQDAAIQADGRIVVAGTAANGFLTEAVLVRVAP